MTDEERPDFLGVDLAADENAPYGYMIDPATGERRPKKKAGRPPSSAAPRVQPVRIPPSLEDLKQAADLKPAGPDRVPGDVGGRVRTRGRGRARGKEQQPKAAAAAKPEPEPAPPFRAGPIARGMNRLYRKAGKLVKMMDSEIGDAIIACTRKDEDDDVTVGEAWEEIARTNPRIRAFLLTMLSGGAWMQLVMAHAPILLAVLMKRGIQRLIPWHKVATALLADDEQDEGAGGQEPGDPAQAGPMGISMPGLMAAAANMTPEDWAQMDAAFGGMMAGMTARMPGGTRPAVVDGPELPDGGGP